MAALEHTWTSGLWCSRAVLHLQRCLVHCSLQVVQAMLEAGAELHGSLLMFFQTPALQVQTDLQAALKLHQCGEAGQASVLAVTPACSFFGWQSCAESAKGWCSDAGMFGL